MRAWLRRRVRRLKKILCVCLRRKRQKKVLRLLGVRLRRRRLKRIFSLKFRARACAEDPYRGSFTLSFALLTEGREGTQGDRRRERRDWRSKTREEALGQWQLHYRTRPMAIALWPSPNRIIANLKQQFEIKINVKLK